MLSRRLCHTLAASCFSYQCFFGDDDFGLGTFGFGWLKTNQWLVFLHTVQRALLLTGGWPMPSQHNEQGQMGGAMVWPFAKDFTAVC